MRASMMVVAREIIYVAKCTVVSGYVVVVTMPVVGLVMMVELKKLRTSIQNCSTAFKHECAVTDQRASDCVPKNWRPVRPRDKKSPTHLRMDAEASRMSNVLTGWSASMTPLTDAIPPLEA